MREYSPGHVGIDVFRCDQCARSMVKHKSQIPPGFTGKKPIEEFFQDCECGGSFKKGAPQRCPYCLKQINFNELLGRPSEDITKRDSGEFYIEGYSCAIKWKDK